MKCWTTNFFIHASECHVFIMNQLKSVYNIPFLDSYSHPIHTCLSMIASNVVFTFPNGVHLCANCAGKCNGKYKIQSCIRIYPLLFYIRGSEIVYLALLSHMICDISELSVLFSINVVTFF